MTIKKYILHTAILFAEIAVLFGLALMPVFWSGEKQPLLVHFNVGITYALLVLGFSSCFMAAMVKLGALRLEADRRYQVSIWALTGGLLAVGVASLFGGVSLAVKEFPELFRGNQLLLPPERMAQFDAVKVRFDAGGGLCTDVTRVVKCGESYGRTMNLYPSEDIRYFADLWAGKINLPRGLICLSKDNPLDVDAYVNYFTTNAVASIALGETWTYVIDLDQFTGEIANWFVGRTFDDAHCPFVRSRVEGGITSGIRRFIQLKSDSVAEGCSSGKMDLLDRGVVVVGPHQSFDMTFRVSLFAGTGVNESNYHYVNPGETIACPLPVPTREGYEFDGWYDGEKHVTEMTKVEKCEAHALKARWRKKE